MTDEAPAPEEDAAAEVAEPAELTEAELEELARAGELPKLLTIHRDQRDPENWPVMRAIVEAAQAIGDAHQLGTAMFMLADDDTGYVTVYVVDR